HLLFSRVPARIGSILISVLVAHTAWHWMGERFDALSQFRFDGREVASALLSSGSLWLAAAAALCACAASSRRMRGFLRRARAHTAFGRAVGESLEGGDAG